jgi:chromosome segregation ATPase
MEELKTEVAGLATQLQGVEHQLTAAQKALLVKDRATVAHRKDKLAVKANLLTGCEKALSEVQLELGNTQADLLEKDTSLQNKEGISATTKETVVQLTANLSAKSGLVIDSEEARCQAESEREHLSTRLKDIQEDWHEKDRDYERQINSLSNDKPGLFSGHGYSKIQSTQLIKPARYEGHGDVKGCVDIFEKYAIILGWNDKDK